MCSITKRNPESKKNYPLPSPVSCFSYSNVEPRTVSDKDAVRFAVSADNSKTAGGAKKSALGSITKSQSKTKNANYHLGQSTFQTFYIQGKSKYGYIFLIGLCLACRTLSKTLQ